ncbi:hypothetical protein D9758_007789 [Tetrapyrgos nigripes]|uniref:J domain-containing protein n=1 Tax=Tetrapyrgos nigripes TaxID=182062 RepID=A0A8H5CZZ6_9AGAR|nr:hypothetical protein D9758_007789 [Tetrapyrgos nigripes]
MNKDEAIRCLGIAQKHRDAGNYSSARKFCQKSMALFETPEASVLLASIDAAEAAASSTSGSGSDSGQFQPSTSASGAETHPSSSGVKHRNTSSSTNGNANGTAGGMGGEKREYTAEQHAVVKRVRACKVTEYYEILSVKKECEEGEIKKAYRKLALALHPDKNGAPGADEAFKSIPGLVRPSETFHLRSQWCRPEDRFGGMPSRSSGFATSPFAGGGGLDGELSPEDLFNMFFGGGGAAFGGGGFGGGPTVFTASFGPGGFRTTRMGGGFPRAQENRQAAEPRSVFIQLLPLIILFGFSLLSALPNLFATPPILDPRFSFEASSRYDTPRHTASKGVNYHVNAIEVMNHPTIGAELRRQGIDLKKGKGQDIKPGPELAKFEAGVERTYINAVYTDCRRALDRKERLRDAEVGLFGIGTDWEKVKKIENEVIPSCVEFEKLNGRR